MTARPSRRPRPARRLVVAAVAAAYLLFGLVGLPRALADTGQGSLTDLAYDGTTLRGVLTLVGSGPDHRVDPTSLTATVGGKSIPVTVQSSSSIRRAVFLVVDTSGSMSRGNNGGIVAANRAVTGFLQRVPADVEVGLVTFSDAARVEVDPTTDRDAVARAAATMRAAGNTALYDAVTLAVSRLGAVGDRSIILLTDGVDDGSKATLAATTAAVSAAGVRLDVVGFKTGYADASGAKAQLAAAGHGTVGAAEDAAQVDAAFAAAARALDSQVTWTVQPGALPVGDQAVAVSGTAGGQPFSISGTVKVTTAPAPLPTATPTPTLVRPEQVSGMFGSGIARWWLFAGLGAVFLGLLTLVGGLALPALATGRRQRIETIEAYTSRLPRVSVNREEATSAITTGLVDLGDRLMAGRESTSRTMALLQRADLPWRAGEWAVLRVVSVVVGIAIGTLALRGDLVVLGMVVGLVVGLLAPSMALRFLANRRARAFELQMPDILMLVASSLATGFSLPQALDAVSKDVAQPAAKEFARVMAETRIGSDIEDAMERMAVRMDSDNMRWTAMAIRIQRQVGGNLAETLRTTAATLREREFLRRHVRALSAEGRLSAYILTALPILMFLYEVNVNNDYISLLWTTTLGWVMVISAVVSMAVGIFWMSRAIRVEV